MEKLGTHLFNETKMDRAIRIIDEDVTAVSNLMPPGFSGRFSPRGARDLLKEEHEINSDRRLKAIDKQTLDFLTVKTKKFKYDLNNLKSKVHALQRK